MMKEVVIFDDSNDEGSGDDYDGDEGDINNTSDGEIQI